MIEITVYTVLILLVLSITVNIIFWRVSFNQLRKVELYERWIEEYEQWIGDVRGQIASTFTKMKTVDEKNLFSKDDDVGFVFQELVNLLKNLNDRVQK